MSAEKKEIFLENPYDVEAVFESLQIASAQGKELIYMDKLLATLRIDSEADIVNLNYRLLRDLKLLQFESIKT